MAGRKMSGDNMIFADPDSEGAEASAGPDIQPQTTSKEKTMFRDLNKLDEHIGRSEVLARLETVKLPKDDKGQKALLDEIKRQYASDEPIRGLNDRINSEDMLAFAQYIDNVINDGKIENVEGQINNVVDPNGPEPIETTEPNVVPEPQPQPIVEPVPTVEPEPQPTVEPEPSKEEPVEVANLPKRMDPTPGIRGCWEEGPSKIFMMTAIAKDSFKPKIRPFYFNPKNLSPEEQELAMRMLTTRGIKPVVAQAPQDMEKSRNPIQQGEVVWIVGAEYDQDGKEIPYRERSNQIKQLKNFWKACMRNKDMAYGLDLQKDDTLPPISDAKKNKPNRDANEGARGEFIRKAGEQLKDIGLAAADAWDKFSDQAFAAANTPEEFGSHLLTAMLCLPWNFAANIAKRKAEKVDLSLPERMTKKPPSFMPKTQEEKIRQAKAVQEFMKKMMEKDPSVFMDMAEKGIFGPQVQQAPMEAKMQKVNQVFAGGS